MCVSLQVTDIQKRHGSELERMQTEFSRLERELPPGMVNIRRRRNSVLNNLVTIKLTTLLLLSLFVRYGLALEVDAADPSARMRHERLVKFILHLTHVSAQVEEIGAAVSTDESAMMVEEGAQKLLERLGGLKRHIEGTLFPIRDRLKAAQTSGANAR